MKNYLKPVILVILVFGLLAGGASAEEKLIKMSTTTSTQASGLLDILLPELEKDTGIQVKVLAKGTGAAIRDGVDGNVDVIFVHAKAREEQFVADGYGTKRYAVMHNDFIIIGPKDDPAGIKGMTNAAAALKKIAESGSMFVSRGDDSGTHTKEQALWKESGLELASKTTTIIKTGTEAEITFISPEKMGGKYLSIGQGMGKVMIFADEKQIYTLADRGTYIKYKFGNETPVDLEIMCEGDPRLSNPYGVIPINPEKHPHVNIKLADQFAQWLVSERGQKVIGDYKLLGKQLFYPDAVK